MEVKAHIDPCFTIMSGCLIDVSQCSAAPPAALSMDRCIKRKMSEPHSNFGVAESKRQFCTDCREP
jgi:hypothetical protein